MFRGLSRTRLAALGFGLLLVAGEASARNEQLQWTHGDPSSVQGFKVYYRMDGSSTVNALAATQPVPNGNTYTYVATVPDTGGVWFSVRAYNAGGDSPSSNEICRGCGSTPPPTNPPPTNPPPTGGTGGVTGFKVWNATTDQVVDNDFQNNETITLSCAAIEIAGSVVSVKKTFDGVAGECENTAPYGYPDGAPGGFDCFTGLTNGAHSVSVTAYSGLNCTGTAYTPVSRNFSVSVSTTPPPQQPAALGTPGKPYLVQ